jgi:hypothetical protein
VADKVRYLFHRAEACILDQQRSLWLTNDRLSGY